MANKVYKSETLGLVDGSSIYVTPLKIKYLREFMDSFREIKKAVNDEDAMDRLIQCVSICMRQYSPHRSTIEDVEDLFDLKTMYRVLEISADIDMSEKKTNNVQESVSASKADSWEDLDLVSLESEIFLIGMWKDYEDLESSLSIPEILATLKAKRDADYIEKKFHAAIQGINLDEQMGQQEEDPWERVKANAAAIASGKDPNQVRVDSNDITSVTGVAAKQAGFGIGMGLEYESI
jgi:hypothetical protein